MDEARSPFTFHSLMGQSAILRLGHCTARPHFPASLLLITITWAIRFQRMTLGACVVLSSTMFQPWCRQLHRSDFLSYKMHYTEV